MEQVEQPTLTVIVKTLQNKTYNVEVNDFTSIASLKDSIQSQTTISGDRQRLIYRGKVLVDEHAIRDYNIEDGHTVHMIAKPENYRELKRSVEIAEANSNTRGSGASGTSSSTLQVAQPAPTRASTSAPVDPNAAAEGASLERVRQTFLTLHTLLSTMDRRAEDREYNHSNQSNNLALVEESKESGDSGERRFFPGQWLDVKDTVNQWLEATILDVDRLEKRLFVHYNGWPARWDEWLPFDSPRLAPFRSRTVHSSLAPQACPEPNILPTQAIMTGPNDVRYLLPELSRWMHLLLPMVDRLAALSTEVM
jgi:hypothetical protein